MLLNMMIYNWSTMPRNMFHSQTVISHRTSNRGRMHFTLLYSMSLDKNLASPRTLFAVAQSGLSNEGEKKKEIINWFSVEWFVNRCIFISLKGLQNGYDLILIYCIKSTKNIKNKDVKLYTVCHARYSL